MNESPGTLEQDFGALSWKHRWVSSQKARIQVLAPEMPSCVIVSLLLYAPASWFLPLWEVIIPACLLPRQQVSVAYNSLQVPS